MKPKPQGMVSHFLFSTLSSGGTQIIAFLTFVVLARLLGTEAFGLVALAVFIIDMMQIIGSVGLMEAVVQRKVLNENEADTAFWANLLLGFLLFALTNLLAATIADAYRQPDLKDLMRVLSVLFLIAPLGAIHQARLTRELRFKALAYRALAASLAGAAIGIPMALLGYGVWALVGQRVFTALATVLANWLSFPWLPQMRFSLQTFKELVGFGGYVSASSVALQINSRIAELMSGIFVGPVAVGLIRAGSRCVDIVNQLTLAPIQQISLPVQSRAQHDIASREQNYAKLSRLSAAVMFPAYLGCFAVAPPLINSLFGHEWLPAGDAIRILSLNVVPLQMNVLILSNLMATGFSRPVFVWSLVQLICGLLAAYLTFSYGWQTMLIANVARSYALLPVGWYLMNKFTGIRTGTILRSIWPALLSAVTMCVCVSLLEYSLRGTLPNIALLFVLPCAGAAIYAPLVLIFDRSVLTMVSARLQTSRQRARLGQD